VSAYDRRFYIIELGEVVGCIKEAGQDDSRLLDMYLDIWICMVW